MKILSTRLHGTFDYLGGIFLIGAPWVFDFARGGAETWVFIACGALMLGAALITDYECGVVPGLSMTQHLVLDGMLGLFLAASPWLFGFSEFVYLPHLLIGLAETFAALLTDTVPQHHALLRERRV